LQAQLDTHSASPNQNDGDNYLPIVDGDFLPAAPSTLLAEGRFAKRMRTIIGWTNNDAVLFTPTDNTTPQQTYRFLRLYLPAFTEAHLQKLLALYPRSDFHNSYFRNGKIKIHAEVYRLGRIFRDLLFTCQPIFIGMILSAKVCLTSRNVC
jgi:carboxylesterase type B